MSGADFVAWLDGVTPTRPFTLDDARELQRLCKTMLPPGALVDVWWTRGDKVHVRATLDGRLWSRSLEIR